MLTEEITSVIAKNLPSQVGDVLKKELLKIEDLENKVKDLSNALDTKDGLLMSRGKEIECLRVKLEKVENAFNEHKKAAGDVHKQKHELDILQTRAELTTEFSERTVNLVRDLYSIPFSNRVLREEVLKNIAVDRHYTESEYVTDKNGFSNPVSKIIPNQQVESHTDVTTKTEG